MLLADKLQNQKDFKETFSTDDMQEWASLNTYFDLWIEILLESLK